MNYVLLKRQKKGALQNIGFILEKAGALTFFKISNIRVAINLVEFIVIERRNLKLIDVLLPLK